MPTTLITWYFYGLGGIGGWVIFLLLAIIAVFWIWYDSLKRNLPAWGWRMGIIVLAGLLLLTMLYRFTVSLAQFTGYIACIIIPGNTPATCVNTFGFPPLSPYYEIIFYVGLLAGLLTVGVAVAYYVNFQGIASRQNRGTGSVYNPPPAPMLPPQYYQPAQPRQPEPPPMQINAPLKSKRPLTHAWLVAQDGHNHQLYAGETTIGRSSENNIYITDDTTLSKRHAKIVEQDEHFRLIDLGSTNGTRVNGQWVKQSVLLEPDDEIQFGDHTVMQFVTSRR